MAWQVTSQWRIYTAVDAASLRLGALSWLEFLALNSTMSNRKATAAVFFGVK